MKFICTGKGFIVGVEFIRDKVGKITGNKIIYSNKLREAQVFSKTKTAVNFLDKYNIEGFIYSPKAQAHELGEKKFIVSKYKDPFVVNTDDDDVFLEEGVFKVVKVLDWGYSDLDFLNDRKRMHEGKELMTKEEALEECIRRNNLLIEKLTKENENNNTRRFN